MNKKIKLGLKSAVLALACLSMWGCADFLDVDPLNMVYDANYWKQKEDVDQVVASCYLRMQDDDFLRRLFIWGESRSDNVMAQKSKDNLNTNCDECRIMREDILTTNSYLDWASFYAVINRCNLVIEKAPQVAAVDPTYLETDMNATIAEVKALRALCYFYLVRTFKDVPFYTHANIDDEQELALPATSGDEIVRTLINELAECCPQALTAWPKVNNKDISYGRITQDAICALLADMCLWVGDFTNAAHYADLVIESKRKQFEKEFYSSTYMVGVDNVYYPLFPDFDSRVMSPGYAYYNLFGVGGFVESIFELDFDDNYKDNGTKANEMISEFWYRGLAQAYTDHPSGPGIFGPAKALWKEINEPDLFAPTKNDSRIPASMRYSDPSKGEESSEIFIAKYAYMRFSLQTGTNDLTKAVWDMNQRYRDDANWIFYRVSDVMLIKAEALIWQMSGNDELTEKDEELKSEAFRLITAVEKRSTYQGNLSLPITDYPNKNQLLDLVYDSRRREFLFEGKRWFDLVRRSRFEGNTSFLLGEVSSKFEGTTATSATSRMANLDGMYWPYLESELDVNPNLKQNPAYPSSDNNNYESTK